ncbi:MAG: hypothetical protein J2P51_07420 [Hyphomicrobiaceae bacterium]|nr:hypothetical protein [Hyphomicrobiaceae bacterium]
MRLRPPLLVSVTRHEEKEHKLQEFICQHLNGLEQGGDRRLASHLLIVARSLASPLVRAIAGLTHEIAASGRPARMILAHIYGEPQPEDWGRAITFSHEIRWAKHPRLIEAHEQLVLGPQTCWIGDCMRRDPAKCDAYESFVEGCGEAAGCATVSFERLWLACQPLVSRSARHIVGIPAGSPPPTVEATPQATAGTRH